MKKIVALLSITMLLALPGLVVGQINASKSVLIGAPLQQQQGAGISADVLVEILTLAAPHFGFTPDDFIRMYHSCECITITEIGPGEYLVVYGGIGIQIVIDGSRQGGASSSHTNSRKR
jgi:hypothetical protein